MRCVFPSNASATGDAALETSDLFRVRGLAAEFEPAIRNAHDTRVGVFRRIYTTSDIGRGRDLAPTGLRHHRQSVEGRGLHDRSHAMALRVDGLTLEHGVGKGVG